MQKFIETEQSSRSKATRPLILPKYNLILTCKSSSINVSNLSSGTPIKTLSNGHTNSYIVSIKNYKHLIISASKNGAIVAWNLKSNFIAQFAIKLDFLDEKNAGNLVDFKIINDKLGQMLVIAENKIFLVEFSGNLTEQLGIVEPEKVTEICKAKVHDSRQVSFFQNFVCFITEKSTIGLLNLNKMDDNLLLKHKFGSYNIERQARFHWKGRDAAQNNDQDAFIECLALTDLESDETKLCLAVGTLSGKVFCYSFFANNQFIKNPPQVTQYHAFGLNDLLWLPNSILVSVGNEPVIVKQKITFGQLTLGESTGEGQIKERTFIPHLHLGCNRIVAGFNDFEHESFLAGLHLDGNVSIVSNQRTLMISNFSDPCSISTTKGTIPKISKKAKANNLAENEVKITSSSSSQTKNSKNEENQFTNLYKNLNFPLAKIIDSLNNNQEILVLPSGKPGTLQFIYPKLNRVIGQLNVSNENFIHRDNGSYCTFITDLAVSNKNNCLAVVEKRTQKEQNLRHCVIKIYSFMVSNQQVYTKFIKAIDYTSQYELKKIKFSYSGKNLLIMSKREDIFVYRYQKIEEQDEDFSEDNETKNGNDNFDEKKPKNFNYTFYKKIALRKTSLLDFGLSFDDSTLAILTKSTIKILDLNSVKFTDGSGLIKTILLNHNFYYHQLEFCTARFYRHNLMLLGNDQNDNKRWTFFKIDVVEAENLNEDSENDSNNFSINLPQTDSKNMKICYDSEEDSDQILVYTAKTGVKIDLEDLSIIDEAKNDYQQLAFLNYWPRISKISKKSSPCKTLSIDRRGISINLNTTELVDLNYLKELGGIELSKNYDPEDLSHRNNLNLLAKAPKTSSFFNYLDLMKSDDNQDNKSKENGQTLGNLRVRRARRELDKNLLLDSSVLSEMANVEIGDYCGHFFGT